MQVFNIGLTDIAFYFACTIGFMVAWGIVKDIIVFVGEVMGGWNRITLISFLITIFMGLLGAVYLENEQIRERCRKHEEERQQQHIQRQKQHQQQLLQIQAKKNAEIQRQKRAMQEKIDAIAKKRKENRDRRQIRHARLFGWTNDLWDKLRGRG